MASHLTFVLFALQRFRTSMFTFRAIASATLQNQHVVVYVEIVWRRWPYTYACNSGLAKTTCWSNISS